MISDWGDGSLLIDPELIAYAPVNYNYNTLHHIEQVRLNIIRLEVLRIRTELQTQALVDRNHVHVQSYGFRMSQPSSKRQFLLRSMLIDTLSAYDYEKLIQNQHPIARRIGTMIDSHMCEYTIEAL